jgi:hypothetical protein
VRHHFRRVVQRPRWKLGRVAGHLAHRLRAEAPQVRIEGPRFDSEERAPFDRDIVLRREPA